MDRKPNRFSRLGVSLIGLVLLGTSLGCQGALLTAMYLTGGSETKAEFSDLKEKKVAVVCVPQVELKFRNLNATSQLSSSVGKLIQKHLKKTTVIDQEKVADWIDNHTYEEYAEIGRGVDADIVIAIDLYDFDIYKGQTIFQGNASYSISVVDCKTTETVFEKTPNPCKWPPTGGVPTTDQSESQFRTRFMKVLSEEIARTFYSYDHRDFFANDSSAFE